MFSLDTRKALDLESLWSGKNREVLKVSPVTGTVDDSEFDDLLEKYPIPEYYLKKSAKESVDKLIQNEKQKARLSLSKRSNKKYFIKSSNKS
jgi:hypothetical protein